MHRRVVITGIGTVSPFGVGVRPMLEGMMAGKCALSRIPEEMRVENVNCHIAGFAPVMGCSLPREMKRGMSPMSLYAYFAAREALEMAGMENERNIGVCVGSTLGSGKEIFGIFDELHRTGNIDHVRSMAFFKIMGHTSATNLAMSLGLTGRIISPTAACSTGLQAIGLAYEAIAYGREERMLCGGTEEFSFLATATFDKIGAASHSDDPEMASLPFDRRRSGVVCSEGSGILFLEDMASARERGAEVLAEIKGFATVSSAGMAHPKAEPAIRSMLGVMKDSGVAREDIGYINAHATATLAGDEAEGLAIAEIFGNSVPVGGLKGYLGHTLAASGAIETAVCVEMMARNSFVGQRSGFKSDENCGSLDYAMTGEKFKKMCVLKNSFALGGIYSSLVMSKE